MLVRACLPKLQRRQVQLPPAPTKSVVPGTCLRSIFSNQRRADDFTLAIQRMLIDRKSVIEKSTRPYRPWMKVYEEYCATEADAISRERHIKVDEVPGVHSKVNS